MKTIVKLFSSTFSMLSFGVAFNGSYWSIHYHCTFRHNSFKWFPIFSNIFTLNNKKLLRRRFKKFNSIIFTTTVQHCMMAQLLA